MAVGANVAVVGAGIVGLATAYSLQKAGAAVTVYEVGRPGGAQSAGDSRIFRHAHLDPRLTAFTTRSRRLYREWGDELGLELVSTGGAVALGPDVDQKLSGLAEVDGLDARRIDAAELAERLPLLAHYDGPALLDAGGGSINAAGAVERISARLGDAIVQDHVLTVRPTASGTVEVRTGTGRTEHDHVVVAAGRGTAAIAHGLGLSLPVHNSAQVRVTFRVAGEPPATLATLQDMSNAFGEPRVYAAASADRTRYGVGIAEEVPVNDDGSSVDPEVLDALADRAVAYVRRALPGLDPTPVAHIHCWVTSLPWGEDGVGVWQHDGVSLVAGNNLFKQAPALGEALATAATGGALPESLLASSRLGRG
ncbi:NAD(P)/FAD-dependent oxidoreductase [Aeromicrobium duanguangcaii]|uniref:FAD-binding oxidoreductase n=1 Tax=Aeromicrobium duanguangcaii TaxID=2968086 RepID=A0ABY5KFB1_9ACTN|nr:FAD-binding oxidoreductase [Aeromicrobium duanguangcaii]MCD9153775.1 FAD-binding oxidoreductase [Aeromicrobium duanguangcaii]UUI69147.1 FAD-binding oxidoreductase [Aeromicrobium duanguangcaii]